MRSIVSCLLAGVVASSNAFALNVDRQAVHAANASARELSLREELTLRAKANWARLALFELERNERIFGAVNGNENKSRRVFIGFADSVLSGSLMAATTKLAYDQFKLGRKNKKEFSELGGYKNRKSLRKLKLEMAKLDREVATATRKIGAPFSGEVRAQLEQSMKLEASMRLKARELKVSPIQRTARGVGLVLAAGLVVTLATHLGQTWMQISMTPEQVEQRKIELRDVIQDIENQLAASQQTAE